MPALPPSAGTGESPLRGRYLVRNPLPNAGLAAADAVLDLLPRSRAGAPPAPRRLLLSIGGHLGDAVIATSVLPVLRAAFPGVRIGVLAGPWQRPVVEGHPDVEWVHTAEHWKLDRSGAPMTRRLLRHRHSSRAALAEIRAVGYDTAVETYPYFPNRVPLLWRAGIPVRIGYDSAGFGRLLTHALPWSDTDRHVADYHLDLLRVLAPLPADLAPACSLPHLVSPPAGGGGGEYVVVHMGGGAALKEWPAEKWRALLERLSARGARVLLTGSGEGQERDAALAARGLPGVESLAGKLGWKAFAACVAGARLVVAADTVAAHLAAAAGVPAVVVATGINNPHHWRPLHPSAVVLTRPVPCAPCHRSRGCEAMTCVRGVEVDEVLAAASRFLAADAPARPGAATPAALP